MRSWLIVHVVGRSWDLTTSLEREQFGLLLFDEQLDEVVPFFKLNTSLIESELAHKNLWEEN